MIPFDGAFLGMQCAKGRGLILPGGKFEWEKDKTYKDTAKRECREEVGVQPLDLKYVWHGPDGKDFITFAFYAETFLGTPKRSDEGVPQRVEWEDLLVSHFAAYYEILFEIMQGKYTR